MWTCVLCVQLEQSKKKIWKKQNQIKKLGINFKKMKWQQKII